MAVRKRQDVPQPDLILFHWSPRARRKGIERHGLMPGSIARGFGPESAPMHEKWRPPFICLCEDPMLAWSLSGRFHPEIETWDLWAVRADDLEGWELILDTYPDSGRHFIKEFRVYHRVFKRHVHYVASRGS